MTGPGAIVVGSGPNGLAAAIALAREGVPVTVLEGEGTPGGGVRSGALTLPGFTHDTCSAVYPLAAASPFFRSLPLRDHGLAWVQPGAPLAHPLEGEPPVLLERSPAATAEGLGPDGRVWRRTLEPFVARWEDLLADLLGPLRVPRHPALAVRFAGRGLRSAEGLARGLFRGRRARALLAGLAAHAVLPLHRAATAAVALVLAVTAHAVGWPFARGGSGRLTDALVAHLRSLGGEVETGRRIRSLADVPSARAILLDLTPRQILDVAGERLPSRYRRGLERFRYGPGVFKLDWALTDPIPWAHGACARAGTVHLGGTLEEIAAGEAEVWEGGNPARPFVLLAQPSRFDARRAPAGRHTAWAYCHVPAGSAVDMTERIEAQVERFAPGFRDCVLARRATSPADLERHNPNCVGGDIGGGVQDLPQIVARPVARLDPYATPVPGLYLCSSSTPPGGGVHGMCGYHAARSALRRGIGAGWGS